MDSHIISITQDSSYAYEYIKSFSGNVPEDTEIEDRAFLLAYSALLAAINRDDRLAVQKFKEVLELDTSDPIVKMLAMYCITEIAVDKKSSLDNQHLWVLAESLIDDSYHFIPKHLIYIKYLAEMKINIHLLKWKEADISFSKAQFAFDDLLNSFPPHLRARYKDSVNQLIKDMKIYEKVIRDRRIKHLDKIKSDYNKTRPLLPFYDLPFSR